MAALLRRIREGCVTSQIPNLICSPAHVHNVCIYWASDFCDQYSPSVSAEIIHTATLPTLSSKLVQTTSWMRSETISTFSLLYAQCPGWWLTQSRQSMNTAQREVRPQSSYLCPPGPGTQKRSNISDDGIEACFNATHLCTEGTMGWLHTLQGL